MACFVIPMTQALVVSAVRHNKMKSSEKESQNPWLSQLPKLEWMLWGGSLMLVIDHLISGELMLKFPFFSALAGEGGLQSMLYEMLVIGLPMSLLITLVYCIMVLFHAKSAKKVRMA